VTVWATGAVFFVTGNEVTGTVLVAVAVLLLLALGISRGEDVDGNSALGPF
jgi:hypothetical protein